MSFPTDAAKARGFTDYCEDCDGSTTKKVRSFGLWNQRDHACGCRDWSYANEKGHPWWRLKWCEYHLTERLAQMKQQEAHQALPGYSAEGRA